jgi:hypothetical protein
MPIFATRSATFGFGVPGRLMPEMSPFTSAMKTGTPRSEKPSASACRVMVLPVPVAPAMRPWRLAKRGLRKIGCAPRPIRMPLLMGVSSCWRESDGAAARKGTNSREKDAR